MKVVLDNSAAQKKAKASALEQKNKKADMHRNYGKVPKYIDRFN